MRKKAKSFPFLRKENFRFLSFFIFLNLANKIR